LSPIPNIPKEQSISQRYFKEKGVYHRMTFIQKDFLEKGPRKKVFTGGIGLGFWAELEVWANCWGVWTGCSEERWLTVGLFFPNPYGLELFQNFKGVFTKKIPGWLGTLNGKKKWTLGWKLPRRKTFGKNS